ncbi:hypothetical protein DPMN_157586 [Dreissena polymorpha]|uniref:HAT C-terminal dimerisation domain-containing protein n=1 Tax=Dreissena polymorpha TaxID=45954 RepID=A0A9D4IME6_DREPO|nr:hypothetical protein DPMN_157586 [Dreissena polymorpha]
MDSLIQSLGSRFSESNMPASMLYQLHPNNIQKFDRSDYKDTVRTNDEFYQNDNFEQNAMSWYDMNKKESIEQNESDFVNLVIKTDLFPAVCEAMIILLTLSATTCTVKGSFSTLRRVKTWLRSTMSDERLSGVCMMSVHRDPSTPTRICS